VSLKQSLREQLAHGRLEEIATLATTRRRVLPTLVALTFDTDLRVCWRAIEALGLGCSAVSEDDPAVVREQLRRLYWLISEESGGICWRAPECMAEIVRAQPKRFTDYLPITFHLIVSLEEEDLGHFRAGALWATGRLAPLARDAHQEVLPAVTAALDDPDSQVRGTAVWTLTQMGETTSLGNRADLRVDEGSVALYRNREIIHETVAQLARRALAPKPA
jgi:methylated-DNA-[protein]-cysteine S-methyltransferase